MHTGQIGGHLAHHSKAVGKRGRRTVSALYQTLCLQDKMFQEVGATGNFCTAEDRELEIVDTGAGSTLQKVKRSNMTE